MLFLKRDRAKTVGGLEAALLDAFPAKDAEEWDRTGLMAGDPAAPLKKVAVALDPTARAVERAAASGANVLVTHHPIFTEKNCAILPPAADRGAASGAIWQALKSDVALMCFHTALDVSHEAQQVLPGMLGLKQTGVLEPIPGSLRKGYGQVCAFLDAEEPTLESFAERCAFAFGRAPRVWGAPDAVLKSVVTCTGSVGGCGRTALRKGYSCIVCGEVKYHEALALAEAGLCIVEVGHDASELPLTGPLSAAVEAAGVPKDRIVLIDQGGNWRTPQM